MDGDKEKPSIPQKDTEHPKLKYLYKYVKADIATNWYEIGVELFDAGDESVLDVISDNHSKDVNKCAGEMLKLWLARNPGATWNQLIIALKEPNIKLDTVAEKIKVMLSKGSDAAEHKVVHDRKRKPLVDVESGPGQLPSSDVKKRKTAEIDVGDIEIDFTKCNVVIAFTELMTILQDNTPECRLPVIKARCIAVTEKRFGDCIDKQADNVESFFKLLSQSYIYCNWLNFLLVEVIISALRNEKLKSLIASYKQAIYSKTLGEVWEYIPQEKVNNKYYSEVTKTFASKNPDDVTVEELIKFSKQLAFDIAPLVKVIANCLTIVSLVPTDKVYQLFLSVVIIPQESRQEDFLQIGSWVVHHPKSVLQELRNEFAIASHLTLLIGYYHGVLLRDVNADLLFEDMCLKNLLNVDDRSLISGGNSVHHRNWLLLEYIRCMEKDNFLVFCELVYKIWPEVGSQLIYVFNIMSGIQEDKAKDLTKAQVIAHQSHLYFQPSLVHIAFLVLIDQLHILLQHSNIEIFLSLCESMMASSLEQENIKLFSDAQIAKLKESKTGLVMLWRLSFFFTWSNHSILRILLSEYFSEALQLLDVFDSRVDPLLSIASYPIPDFSSDMIPVDTSTHTILAIRCGQRLYECTLQYVYNMQSVIMEKCHITQHCLRLLAVKNDPTILYWTIPKCVVQLISNQVPCHSEYLYSKGVLEVLVYPKLLLSTGDDISIGSSVFIAENDASNKEFDDTELSIKEMQKILPADIIKMRFRDLNVSLQLKDTELQNKDAELRIKQKQLESMNKENKQLHKEITEAKLGNNQLIRSQMDKLLEESEKRNEQLNSKLLEVTEKKDQLNEENLKINSELRANNAKLNELDKTIEQLKSELTVQIMRREKSNKEDDEASAKYQLSKDDLLDSEDTEQANKLPSVRINNAVNFEQQRQHSDDSISEFLVVPQLEREFHRKGKGISRSCSDTDVTKLPYREQSPLHIKGGENIVAEEPCFESLSFSANVDDEKKYYPKEDSTLPVDVPIGGASFYIPDIESPSTPMAENIPSSFLMLEGPTEDTENGMPPRKLLGSSSDFSYHLRNEYGNNVFLSAMVFPSAKPLPKPGTGGQFPDVFVKYTCKPNIWPLHQYTENPMRYNVGRLPKKSMNNVYYSLDETFAFKEEISKVLLIEKKEIFKKIINLNPYMFVPIIAYLHCNNDQGQKCGYQIMEYYKDGSTHDLFKVNVNGVNCTCFLEIYHQKHKEYAKAQEYQRGLEVLDKKLSVLSNELKNLVRNFYTVIVQMLKAVECLHFDGLVHRDIKPHNFLVTRMKSCHCKPLIFCSCDQSGFCILLKDYDFVSFATNQRWDFTETKFDYSKKLIKPGTLGYRPIELNFDNEGPEAICDPKSDIYSLGVSILEIVAGRHWNICENYIDEILKISLSPLFDKSKALTSLQQYRHKLTETYISLQEKNTILQSQGIVVGDLSEITDILASMCTEESYTDIKPLVEQLKFIAVEKDDGIQTVMKTIIKAKYIDGCCAIYSWQVADSKWICSIIQRCVNVCPNKRPYIQELLQN